MVISEFHSTRGDQVVVPQKRNTKPAPNENEGEGGNIYFHKVINFQRHFNMQLRIGVVNHIQPGGVLLQQTDTYRWQICLVVPTKGTREAGGGPTPLPPPQLFPFEEVNFCHRAVTNAIKVMQFLLLAEREKSCLLTRMKDGK